MNKLIPLLVAFVSLALSALFNQVAARLVMRGGVNITASPNIWWIVLLEAAFIGLMLLSFWLIAIKYLPPPWTSAVILIIALAGALYLPVMSSGARFLIPSLTGPTRMIRLLVYQFRPGSFFAFQSIALAVSAAIALVRSSTG